MSELTNSEEVPGAKDTSSFIMVYSQIDSYKVITFCRILSIELISGSLFDCSVWRLLKPYFLLYVILEFYFLVFSIPLVIHQLGYIFQRRSWGTYLRQKIYREFSFRVKNKLLENFSLTSKLFLYETQHMIPNIQTIVMDWHSAANNNCATNRQYRDGEQKLLNPSFTTW